MPYTRSFEGYAPPRRYDGLPFTSALIREAATAGGPYTTIDTKALTPADADPANPVSRNFTTDDATLETGWYIIRWQDAASATFDSDPIQYVPSGSSSVITAAEVREWSNVTFADLGYPAPTSGADRLQRLVDRALEYVLDVTGLEAVENVPDGLQATWEEAVQRRTEQLAYNSSEDAAETGGDFDLIKSFGAGKYNETRRDMGDSEKAKVVNPWPVLDDLLKRLMTPDKLDWWYERWGAIVPASEITEMDWFGSNLMPPDFDTMAD